MMRSPRIALLVGLLLTGAELLRPTARAAQPAAAGGRTVRICAGKNNLPLSDEGTPAGIEIELTNEIFRRAGVAREFVWIDLREDDVEQSMVDGRCDLALGAVLEADSSANAPRPDGIIVSAPYYYTGYYVIHGRTVQSVRRLADLDTVRIALEGESVGTYTLRQQGHSVYVLRNAAGVVAAVADGRARYGYLWGPVAAWDLRANRDVIVDSTFVPDARWGFAYALRAVDAPLRSRLNVAIRQVTEDGTARRTFAKYRVPYLDGPSGR